MVDLKGILIQLAEHFSKAQVRFALIGGLALHAAGHHRSTGDVDLLVHGEDVAKAKEIVISLGYKIVHENADVLQFVSPWGLVGGIDFLKAHRKYALKMIERARPYTFDAKNAMPSIIVEDLIGLKLQALNNDPSRSSQDMSDIEWLLRRYAGALDMGILREYFALFSMERELEAILLRVEDVKRD